MSQPATITAALESGRTAVKSAAPEKDHLSNLDILRALAALAVCFYHFDLNSFLGVPWVSNILKHGHYGVDVFFVISGFVMPLSLYRSKFRTLDAGTFLRSRFIRLYPAYLLSMGAAILLWYLSSLAPGFHGKALSVSIKQLVTNLTLTCDFFDTKWLLSVYWTLSLEAQYYILLAFTFTWLTHSSKAGMLSMLALWLIAPLIVGKTPTVFTWTALFSMGILVFLRRERLINNMLFWGLLAAATVIHWKTKGPLSGTLGPLTALIIAYVPPLRWPSLIWVGTVSYSLYLIHVPFGVRVINLAERLPHIWYMRLPAIFLALAVALVTAFLFFRFIEAPSHRLARSFKSKKREAKTA